MNEQSAAPEVATAPLSRVMAPALELEARVASSEDGLVATWVLSDGAGVVAEGSITLSGEASPIAPPAVADWALYAALPAMIMRGGTVRLRGAATWRALADAAEIGRAWAAFAETEAHPATFEAETVSNDGPSSGQDEAALVLAEGDDVSGALPPWVALRAVVVDGPATPWRAVPGTMQFALTAEHPAGPPPADFSTLLRRAAALHLLSSEARFGLLRIEAAMAPRVGAPATPAHAAAFLSGGAMAVIPLLDDGAAFRPRYSPATPGLVARRAPVTLFFDQSEKGGATRREMVLEGLADSPRGERMTMWWEMPGETGMPTPPVLDQMVAACVIPALERGQDLVVKGPVSRLAAVNLPMLAATRAAWGAKAPRGPVAILAESVIDLPARTETPRAVLTFSGGADSFHSLLWRTGPDAPRDEPKVEGAVLSLGFDFPLAQRAAFEAHRARIAPVLERRGVALHVVHANSRGLGIAVWDNAAMPMISAALSQFAHRYTHGLLAGGVTYPYMAVPMIQPPLLDRTLSGGWFGLATDGASIGRTEKMAMVAAHPDAMAVLRVCYNEQSPDFARNCCACLKCRRTMLNFLGAGVANPPCFDTVPDPLELAATPFHKRTDLLFAAEVIGHARANGTAGAWADLLDQRIAAWRPERDLPPETAAAWVRQKVLIWGERMAQDPIGTPRLAARKIAARIDRLRR